MNPLVPALALTLAACTSSSTVLPASSAESTVQHVIDGDTVAMADGEKIRIRGLNTPETHRPNTPVQCGGPEATTYAREHLLGHSVRLVTDPGDLRDRWGRLVAEVWVGERSYAADAVRGGMGKAYLYDKRHPAGNWAEIEAAEREAQAMHRGLWGACPS